MDFNCGQGAMTNIAYFIKNYGVPNTYIEVGVFEGNTTFWVADQLLHFNKGVDISLNLLLIMSYSIKTTLFSNKISILILLLLN